MNGYRVVQLLAAFLCLGRGVVSGQVTGKQGESAPDPNTFHGSMTIELPIRTAVNPSSWRDAWAQILDPASMAQLRKMNCDGIHIEELWFKAKSKSPQQASISLKVKIRNPNNNHDKKVWLTFLVPQTDGRERMVRLDPLKIDESDAKARIVLLDLDLTLLSTDPPPTMTISIRAENV